MIVVLAQNNLSGPTIRDFEESFVADLLMKVNLEVSIIDCLSELQDDDTGHLCLQGIKGDMFLAHWGDNNAALTHLSRLDIVGTVNTVTANEVTVVQETEPQTAELPILTPGVYDANRRNIFLMSLDSFDTSFPATARVSQIAANPSERTQPTVTDSGQSPDDTRSLEMVRPMPKRTDDSSAPADDPLESLLGELDDLDL